MATTRAKDPGQKEKAAGAGGKGRAGCGSRGTPWEKGARATGAAGAGGHLTSGCRGGGSSPDSDRGDSCRPGATALPPGCLLCSSSMPGVP